MKFIGRKIEVGLGKETARGTAVVPTYWVPNTAADVEDKIEGVNDENTVGVIEDASDFKITKKWSEGKLEGKITDQSFGLLLLAAFGQVSSAVKETTAYNHTFTVLQSAAHPTLTVEVKNPNLQLQFANSVIKDLEIKAELKKFVEYTANIQGKVGAISSNTPSYTAENDFVAKNISLKLASDLAGLSSATAIDVIKVDLKIEKNPESDDVLGSDEPSDYSNKDFVVTGSIELYYDATTYHDLALGGTEQAMAIIIQNSDVTIGATSNPGLEIDLAKAKLTKWATSGNQKDIIKETLTFKGFYSLSDTSMISAILTNEVTAY